MEPRLLPHGSMTDYLDPAYAFSNEFLAPLRLSKKLPLPEGPEVDYLAGRAEQQAKVFLNAIAVKARDLLNPLDTLREYEELFPILRRPECLRTWRSDLVFAEQRLSGMHPNFLERTPNVPPVFDASIVKDATTALFGTQQPTLFWCNWARYVANVPNGVWDGRRKFMKPTAALFGWRATQAADRGELVPIAIVVDANDPTTTTTPLSDPYAWLAARVYAQVADVSVHEMRSHLYAAHFFQEPIAVATGRYLPRKHPVHLLLEPHLRFLLFNNDLGKKVLVNPGGSVDQLLAGTLAGSLGIVQAAFAEHDFEADAFPNDLAARGVDDATALPHYPYRDDGQCLWDAIGTFVGEYVDLVYPDDAALAADTSLKAWWTSLAGTTSSPAESGLKGVPRSQTKSALAFILQRILFTAGPYHSAVNYPQYEYLAFTPNQPGAAYGEFSTAIDSENALLRIMPPFKQAMKQLELADQLAGYRYDRFAEYRHYDVLGQPGVPEAVSRFRVALDAAERAIDERNHLRRLPYLYLKPSLITNSTSV